MLGKTKSVKLCISTQSLSFITPLFSVSLNSLFVITKQSSGLRAAYLKRYLRKIGA